MRVKVKIKNKDMIVINRSWLEEVYEGSVLAYKHTHAGEELGEIILSAYLLEKSVDDVIKDLELRQYPLY